MNQSHELTRRKFLGTTALAVSGAATGVLAAPAEPADYQIGCYTRCFDQYDYLTGLDAIAEAGYKFAGIMTAKSDKGWAIVTVDTTPDEASVIGNEVRKRELQTISLFADFSAGEGPDKAISGLRRLIDNTVACGSPHLMIGGTTDETVFENYYKAVGECCDYAREKKVVLSIKPHGGQNATGPQCRAILQKINKPNFRLWYDPGNIFYYSDGKLDPVDDSAEVDGLLSGMSVKDFKPPKEVLLTPGTGRVKFDKVMARLRKGGFIRGPLVVECVKRGELKAVTKEARSARLFLERIISQL